MIANTTTKPLLSHSTVVVSAAVAFLVAPLWYSPLMFGSIWAQYRPLHTEGVPTPPAIELIGEFTRILVVAYVFAGLIERLNITGWIGAVKLGLALWIGFQAMAVLGSVLHEGYPWQLYLIHAGHALGYMVVLSAMLGMWRQRAALSEKR